MAIVYGILTLIATFVAIRHADEISAALRDIHRGGPRPPSHPIPADDSRILNRRRAKPAGFGDYS